MNQKKRVYNTRDLPQEEEGEALGKRDEMGIHILGRGVLSPGA